MAVLVPMPTPSVSTAISANPGALASARNEKRMSEIMRHPEKPGADENVTGNLRFPGFAR